MPPPPTRTFRREDGDLLLFDEHQNTSVYAAIFVKSSREVVISRLYLSKVVFCWLVRSPTFLSLRQWLQHAARPYLILEQETYLSTS